MARLRIEGAARSSKILEARVRRVLPHHDKAAMERTVTPLGRVVWRGHHLEMVAIGEERVIAARLTEEKFWRLPLARVVALPLQAFGDPREPSLSKMPGEDSPEPVGRTPEFRDVVPREA